MISLQNEGQQLLKIQPKIDVLAYIERFTTLKTTFQGELHLMCTNTIDFSIAVV